MNSAKLLREVTQLVDADRNGKFVLPDGTIHYYQRGLLHRLDGPAEVRKDGTIHYYQRGLLHRLDGPAEIRKNGTELYYRQGVQWIPNRLERISLDVVRPLRKGKTDQCDRPWLLTRAERAANNEIVAPRETGT